MKIHHYTHDIPEGINWGSSIAIDTEAMGLNPHRDRLCVVQISSGDGEAHLVTFPPGSTYEAPNLKALLRDPKIEKIFHFARFDIAIIYRYLGVMCTPLFCTKIASKLTRTYTERHGLKEICKEVLGVEISKQEQSSDWGAPEITKAQMEYAAGDVLYLHGLRDKFLEKLKRENRTDLAIAAFNFLPARAILDLMGWEEMDIFQH